MKYYIIQVEDGKGGLQYVTEGDWSYFDLDRSDKYAIRFPTQEAAKEVLAHKEFTERNTYSDGLSSPPHIIWNGLRICNERPKENGFIKIIEVVQTEVYAQYIEDELK